MHYFNKYISTTFFIIVLSLSTACSNRIALYDPLIDQSVTALHKKSESFFITLERNFGKKESEYSTNIPFYDEVKLDISAIKIRVKSREKNEKTFKQVCLLENSFDSLEVCHKEGFTDLEEIKINRSAINIQFESILKLEINKRKERQ